MADAVLDGLVQRLEEAARALRDPALDPARAAELAEECARIAGQAADRLDREVRAAEQPGPGRDQMRLQGA